MMNFIFFGRLAREKGFDLLVQSLLNISYTTGELPGNISIFGEGDLRDMLFETFSESPIFEDCSHWTEEIILENIELFNPSLAGGEKKIYFFGWQSQTTVRSILRVSHFSLMPSRFLETFGLSALESLSEGVPVLGFRKGGLTPFIPKELSVHFSTRDEENIEALSRKMVEVSEQYSGDFMDDMADIGSGTSDSPWKVLSNRSRFIADSYTEGRWMEQIRKVLPKDACKILLVSDYVTLLGGIETHMQTIAKALRRAGYEVEIFGWEIPKGRWTKLLRVIGLVYSLCNISSAIGIRKKIQEYEPDAIGLHSVSRFLGPLVVHEVNRSHTFSLVTYHDLGLWSPFPSKVESEEMIPKTGSLGSFLQVIASKNPLVYLAAYVKYFQIFVLRKLLKDIDIHIVPSAFLLRYVRDIGEVPTERAVVLEHFL